MKAKWLSYYILTGTTFFLRKNKRVALLVEGGGSFDGTWLEGGRVWKAPLGCSHCLPGGGGACFLNVPSWRRSLRFTWEHFWRVAGRHNCTLESHLSSWWDCMGLKLLMYRAGTPCSGSVLMLHQTFGIPPVVHPPQHSWVVLLCFSSKSWRKKNY